MKEAIIVSELKKTFNQKPLFEDISFKVNQGDVIAFLGPNGCGKSTILNIISNLIEKDSGECKLHVASSEISYVFQNYRDSLLPWLTSYQNLLFPLKIQKNNQRRNQNEGTAIIDNLQKNLRLNFSLNKYPYELSGGQQQIIAFVRALMNKPRLLLIDEPFSALDYENNLLLRKYLQEYYLQYKPTILIITHNIEEAVHLANRIIVFSKSPTKILSIIENQVPYPRDVSFLHSKEYNKTKDKAVSLFREALNYENETEN